MAQYGRAAVAAVEMLKKDTSLGPVDAWKVAIAQETESVWSRKKSCPKGAFLGLCEDGLISGVKRASDGAYSGELKNLNKRYAVRMVEILSENSSMAQEGKKLWLRAVEGKDKKENGQRDIVESLFKHNYLNL